ncbi:MAG: hypothetical protein ACOY0S_00705 [Patescibacteria group bacterium]
MLPKILRLILGGGLLMILLLPNGEIYGAKVRVRKKPTRAALAYSTAKLSRATHSLIVNFLNLDKVKRVEYALSYAANGIPQGVIGTVNPGGSTREQRDLYFGTCSRGVCTAHYNIRNATLTITAYLKSGGTYIKRYRVKI